MGDDVSMWNVKVNPRCYYYYYPILPGKGSHWMKCVPGLWRIVSAYISDFITHRVFIRNGKQHGFPSSHVGPWLSSDTDRYQHQGCLSIYVVQVAFRVRHVTKEEKTRCADYETMWISVTKGLSHNFYFRKDGLLRAKLHFPHETTYPRCRVHL